VPEARLSAKISIPARVVSGYYYRQERENRRRRFFQRVRAGNDSVFIVVEAGR